MTLDELLSACTRKGFQGSGPGGQHRNKTNTGVWLTHREYNLEIKSCEGRSAKENTTHALHRMQMAIALNVRETPPAQEIPFPGSNGHLQPSNALVPLFVAHVFDIMATKRGDTKAAHPERTRENSAARQGMRRKAPGPARGRRQVPAETLTEFRDVPNDEPDDVTKNFGTFPTKNPFYR